MMHIENSEYDQEITNCRQTHGTARKSHTITMRHQEDKLSIQNFALDSAAVEVQERSFILCLLNSIEVWDGEGPYSACSQNTV